MTNYKDIHIKPRYSPSLPIKEISLEQQQAYISLSTQILTAKKANPNTDISALEKEIDRLVYDLYGLTEEEIKIVEGT